MRVDADALERRALIATSGSLLAVCVAGCLGDDGDDSEGDGSADDHRDDVADERFDELGVGEFRLLDSSGDSSGELASVHGGHWDGDLPPITVGEGVAFEVAIEDEDGEPIELGDEYELAASVGPDDPEGIVDVERADAGEVRIRGEEVGVTAVVFQIGHDGHAHYRTPSITVQVVDEDHDDGGSHDVREDEEGHDHEDDGHGHDDHDH